MPFLSPPIDVPRDSGRCASTQINAQRGAAGATVLQQLGGGELRTCGGRAEARSRRSGHVAVVKEQGSAPMQVNAEEGQLISCSLCRRVLTAETTPTSWTMTLALPLSTTRIPAPPCSSCESQIVFIFRDCVHLPCRSEVPQPGSMDLSPWRTPSSVQPRELVVEDEVATIGAAGRDFHIGGSWGEARSR
jgi:hypothetical protein